MMRSPGLLAALVALGWLCGCSHDAPKAPRDPEPDMPRATQPPSALPPEIQEAPTEPPKPVCQAEARRCTAQGQPEACLGDGSGWQSQEACAAQEACLGGYCAPLPPGGDAASLLPLGPGGQVQRWAVVRELPRQLQKSPQDALSKPDKLRWETLCAPQPQATVIEGVRGRRKPAGQALLALKITSARDQELWFKAGAIGELGAWLDGEPLMQHKHDNWYDALPDEWVHKAQVTRGEHILLMHLEQEERWEGRVRLRLHNAQHQRPQDVAISVPWTTQGCGVGQQLQVELERSPVQGGVRLGLSMDPAQLSPRGQGRLPYEVTLVQGDQRHQVRQGELFWEGGALRAQPEASFVLKLPQARGYTLEVSAGGDTWRRELLFHGALHDRVVGLLEAFRAWQAPQGLERGSLESYTWHLEELERLLNQDEPDAGWIETLTAEAESLWSALSQGRDPYQWRSGLVRRAYRSELDGQLQPYMVHVPSGYGPDAEAMPAVMVFHGLNNEPPEALRALIGEARSGGMSRLQARREMPRFPDTGALLVSPWGYGDNGQRLMGEWDVMRVTQEIQRVYRVDPRRVSLTGYSLGGTVAFTAPLHHPDVFSMAAPLCGYPNLMGYQEVRRVKRQPWEEKLLQKRYLYNYAENGLHLPLYVVHGGLDQPARSEVITDRYEKLGYRYHFDLQPELGHNVWDHAYESAGMVRRLMRARLPEQPEQVRLRTGAYRYNKAWWVTLEAMEDSTELAQVDAVWRQRSAELHLTVENVRMLALDTGQLPNSEGGVLYIQGQKLPLAAGPRTWVVHTAQGWTSTGQRPVIQGRHKHRGQSGPLDMARLKPSLVVYGTQDPAQTDTNLLVARDHAQINPRTEAHFPIKADSEVTEQDRKEKTLILIGGPSSNSVTAQVADQLPVKFTADALEMGGERYTGEDVGVSLIWPSPFSDDQYLVLHAGRGFVGTLASRHLPEMAPDYLIYDARMMEQWGATLLDRRPVLAGGFFDEGWRLP